MEKYIEYVIKNDILDELKKHNIYDIDESLYIEFCNSRVDIYMKQINLSHINNKYTSSKLFNNKNKCRARIWAGGYCNQCSHNIINDKLCQKHLNIYSKFNNLRYDFIDNPKPRNDLISGKQLNWINKI